MRDGTGRQVRIGDRVQLWQDHYGTVVCSLEDRDFSERYPASEWGHLSSGALIELENGSLFHYVEPDEDFKIVRATAFDRRNA